MTDEKRYTGPVETALWEELQQVKNERDRLARLEDQREADQLDCLNRICQMLDVPSGTCFVDLPDFVRNLKNERDALSGRLAEFRLELEEEREKRRLAEIEAARIKAEEEERERQRLAEIEAARIKAEEEEERERGKTITRYCLRAQIIIITTTTILDLHRH